MGYADTAQPVRPTAAGTAPVTRPFATKGNVPEAVLLGGNKMN